MKYHVCLRRKGMPRIHLSVCLKGHDPKARACRECGFYKEGEEDEDHERTDQPDA